MIVETQKLPTNGKGAIDIRISADMNVTAFSARQKVTRYVACHISTQMHAGEPELVINDRIVWRVPIILSLPPTGDLGHVGHIDVDVETGMTNISAELIEEIEQRATQFAVSPTLQATTVG